MQVRMQSIDSVFGEETTETIDIDTLSGDAIRDFFNREIAALGCPVAGLYTLAYWDTSHDHVQQTGAFVLKGLDHFVTGIVYKTGN